MRRLRDFSDGAGDDPVFLRGLALLRRTPPTPRAAGGVRHRVWWAIGRVPARPRGLERASLLKLAVVASVALAAGTAGAVIARRWIVPPSDTRALRPAPPAVARVDRTRPLRAAVPPPGLPAAPTAQRPEPWTPPRSAPRKPAAPAAAGALARERSEVLDALVALRRANDPVRAGALLAKYLAAHPRGALREEALVLGIEAADARGDRAGGAQAARAYLVEFPGGRFLSFARGHVDPAH